MARYGGGAIVIDARLDGALFEAGSRELEAAARGFNSALRRVGSQLTGSAQGFARAAEVSVKAAWMLRREQGAALEGTVRAWMAAREQLNGLSGALRGLRESAGLAFGPVLAAAAPALTALTDLLSDAVLKVGMFAAALTGQDAFIRATGAQKNYAAGMKRTTRSARELGRQLASFDRLDILKRDRTASGSGGGASALGEVAEKLRLIPIDAGILNFVDRLKALFARGDYEGVGRALADGLNGALEHVGELVRWENVGGTVQRYVDGFCGIFNGLAEGVNWQRVGEAFGGGVDTLARTANRLLSGIRLAELGKAVGDGLSAAVRSVDFGELGEALGRLLTAKLTVVANAAARFDWGEFGERLAKGFGGLLKGLGDALDGVDWAGLAGNLTRGLNRFIRRVKWDEAGQFLGRRANDALEALRAAVSGFEWGRAGRAFSKAVNGLVSTVDWTALGRWLDRTVQGALDFALSFVRGFDADGFASGIGKALEQVDWGAIASKLWSLLTEAASKAGGIGKALLGGDASGALAKVRAVVEFVTGSGNKGVLEGLHALLAPGASVGVALEKKNWRSIGEFVGTGVTVLTALGKANWTTLGGFVGDKVNALVNLAKGNFQTLGDFIGDRVSAAVSLAKDGWRSLQEYVGDRVGVKTELKKDGWSSLKDFVGDRLDAAVRLVRNGWSSVQGFVGENVSVKTSLAKWGWTSLAGFVGEYATIKTSLAKWGWASLAGFVGEYTTVRTLLQKWGWTSLEGFVGEYATVRTLLRKWGWTSLESFVGEYATVRTLLQKWGWTSIGSFVGDSVGVRTILQRWGWTSLSDFVGNTVQAKVQLIYDTASRITTGIMRVLGLSGGGAITAGGGVRAFAGGGVIRDGAVRFLRDVPHYAKGTGNAHGTVFVAGEAGPEVMGHINGRTEILNKSQIAQALYGAVVSGMSQAVNALGRYLAAHMTRCANALIGATISVNAGGPDAGLLARLSAVVERAGFAPPVMAGGTVVPYEVSARDERMGEALRGALDANNEDLIQTIISVVGAQTAAIVSALQSNRQDGGGGLTAQQVIGEINRRTQMFGASPLKGV